MNDKKNLTSGDNSINYQANNITVNSNLSYTDVKAIALDVYESNFYRFTGIAHETSEQRAKEITDQIIKEFAERNPEGLKAAENPDFLYSLFQVQKEYAKCGDKELGDILVDILIDRSKEDQRSLRQIVLNEALTVAPKLGSIQLDLLACCFTSGYTKSLLIRNIEDFQKHIETEILIFTDALEDTGANWAHLEYTGCCAIRTGSRNLNSIFLNIYKGLFCKGFTKDHVAELIAQNKNVSSILRPCLHDDSLLQLNAIDDDVAKSSCEKLNLTENEVTQLLTLNNQHLMSKDEVEIFIKSNCPGYERFLQAAKASRFFNVELTSVGIAIAHAHLRKNFNLSAELSIWI